MTVKIPGSSNASHNAAIWLRAKSGIPKFETLFDEFEKEFNCQLEFWKDDDRTDPWTEPVSLVFDNEHEATLFLLRWA